MHRNGRPLGFKLGPALLLAIALAGCGGGGDGGGGSVTPPTATANVAPTIQGQPSASVAAGQSYVFRPSASDANGDSLSFSAANLPAWATLNTATGEISGTPTSVQVYSGITLTVSDGKAASSLGPFSIAVTQIANGSAVVSWMPPSTNTDGSTLQDLSGYRVMYGQAPDALVETVSITNPSLSSYVVENLSPGTWYFAVATVNSAGMTSSPSSLVSKTVT